MYFRVMLAENSDKNCVNPKFFHMCKTSIPTTQSHRRPTRGNNGCLLSPDYIRSASKNKFVHQIQSIERQEIYHVHVLANLTDIYIIAICVTVVDCLDVSFLLIQHQSQSSLQLYFHSCIFQNDFSGESSESSKSLKSSKMASESSKCHQTHQSHQNGIKVIKASFLSGHLGILPNFQASLHSWIETIDLGI